MKQAVDEVSAEQQGDAQADDRFRHGETPLKPPAGAGVGAHDDQDDDPKGDVDKVKHVWLRLEKHCSMRVKSVSRPYRIWQFGIKGS
jgi:hypothetical protein